MEKLCVRYCRIGNKEFLPNETYTVELNPVDKRLRIYSVWGNEIVNPEFINANFI